VDSVLRAFAVYAFLLVIFRISGKRTLSQVTTFDFVLLLIIAESTQQALLGQDFSLTNFVLVVVTLLGIDIGLSLLKRRWSRLDIILEGQPLILVDNGQPLQELMDKARVDNDDILTAARHLHGLERMDQIKYAVLERSGGITIVPKQS